MATKNKNFENISRKLKKKPVLKLSTKSLTLPDFVYFIITCFFYNALSLLGDYCWNVINIIVVGACFCLCGDIKCMIQKQPPEVFYKKGVLKSFENLQENTCGRVSFSIKFQVSAYNFIKKETSPQMYSVHFEKFLKTLF